MKGKLWTASPIIYLAVISMFGISFFSYGVNTLFFIVGLSISTVFALSLLFLRLQFWFHVKEAMRTARGVLSAENEKYLEEFSLPTVVAGLEGDIIWASKSFCDTVNDSISPLGDSVQKYIFPKTIKQILGEHGANIKRNDKQYTVHIVKTEKSYVIYFVDDTYLKDTLKEYTDKKVVISLISFDNKQELLRYASGGEESRITSEVETILREWSHEMGGFMRMLSGGRYMMITDESHIDLAKSNRFNVLDKIRTVKGSGELTATISVGIGRQATTVLESENHAKQALEMALGRGGDQVAIMNKSGNYDFFGGVSKGVEKRDKVRTRVIAATLTDRIKSADKVFIMGHKNSDFDSIGSCCGMWAVISKGIKKSAFIVVNKNTSLATPLIDSMSKSYPEQRVFITPLDATQEATDKSLTIVVDTHSAYFTESTELLEITGAVVIIDHHRMVVNHIKNSVIFYHEPYASSASEMIAELIQYIDENTIAPPEAQALLSGIMLDTKNFVLKTGIRTFEAAAFLRRRGADTVEVKKYFANSLNTYKEKVSLVASAEIYKNCAISFSEKNDENTRVSSAQAADELLSIEGVKAAFVLFELNGEVNISGRSLGDLNVQVILEHFGGGGHLTMAGAQLKDTNLHDAKNALMDVIDDFYRQQNGYKN